LLVPLPLRLLVNGTTVLDRRVPAEVLQVLRCDVSHMARTTAVGFRACVTTTTRRRGYRYCGKFGFAAALAGLPSACLLPSVPPNGRRFRAGEACQPCHRVLARLAI